jgi:hypothetical protein
MKFQDYFNQVDREYKAPVTGDVVNFEINSVKSISAPVVEHTDSRVVVQVDERAWKLLDQHRLISEATAQQMAEFVLTFERNGEKIHKKFLHQPPMEAAGITQDFVRNIAKANPMHETMVEQGYKLKRAEAKLVETDQLPESDVNVLVRNPQNTEARVTFECVFRKSTSDRARTFLETYDCSEKAAGNYWSLPVNTGA